MTCEKKPFFSVIIPVHNRADLISRCLKSVTAQTFSDYEIIVVDDGSIDDIGAACAPFVFARMRLVRQENSGASSARNTGIDLAEGLYVTLLDSDDIYLPDHLQSMRQQIELFPEAVIYSPVLVERSHGVRFIKPPRAIAPGENMATYLMCDRGFVQTSGLCLLADVARRVRYRTDARYGDDTDFAIRLQNAGYNFVMATRPTVVWADDLDHERLSDLRTPLKDLFWLADLRPNIPSKAYHAYRGWHLAKSIAYERPFEAMRLYLNALFQGAYSPRLAVLVLLQVVLPTHTYRRITNYWVSMQEKKEVVI